MLGQIQSQGSSAAFELGFGNWEEIYIEVLLSQQSSLEQSMKKRFGFILSCNRRTHASFFPLPLSILSSSLNLEL